ncbi:tetratricopeptide repeat protein [bacterium]|nr:tetratricopeptide repeat protein [bacterium]
MSKTMTKKELRAPDSFQELAGRGAAWIESNIKILIGIALVTIGACMAWIGYGYYSDYKESQAELALFPVQDRLMKELTKPETLGGSLSVTEFSSALKEYSHQKASAVAAIQVIGALSTKENTEALQKEILSSVSISPSKSNVLFGFWLLTKGQVFVRNGELASAKEAYKEVLSATELKEFHPKALLELGALSEKEGDFTGAKDFYSRIAKEYPDSEAKSMAEKLIIHLDLLGQATKGS